LKFFCFFVDSVIKMLKRPTDGSVRARRGGASGTEGAGGSGHIGLVSTHSAYGSLHRGKLLLKFFSSLLTETAFFVVLRVLRCALKFGYIGFVSSWSSFFALVTSQS